MCKDLGIQPSLMTELKLGEKSSMKIETASAKSLSYFDVPIDTFLGDEEISRPPLLQRMNATLKKVWNEPCLGCGKNGQGRADVRW
jgi:hypothetical protein